MKRIGHSCLMLFAACVIVGALATAASATPMPNSAVVLERLYDNCPLSTVTSSNGYPGLISISDTWDPACVGFANGHAWNFSTDGATSADLGNNGNYKFRATVIVTAGAGTVEAGIHIAPWWNNMDGRFQVRIPDGEIACFGGRLPFYSFTTNFGLVYAAGTPATMEIEYHANGLSMVSPASIVYRLIYGGNSYSSPVLLFDEGNPAENPPHGLWGSLDPSLAGGVVQVNNGSNGHDFNASWYDISFTCLDCETPAKTTSWGRLKVLYH